MDLMGLMGLMEGSGGWLVKVFIRVGGGVGQKAGREEGQEGWKGPVISRGWRR